VGEFYAATLIWLLIIIAVVMKRDEQMPEGSSVGMIVIALVLGLATVLLSGCQPYKQPMTQAGPPPVFDWKASAALDAYRAPDVRIVE
tara:strand:+ start:105 stop:368 length:264 start_codon:yes stop_codon:yes gene_type:complete